MDRIFISGGTGFVGKWMDKTQPKGLDVYYWNRAQYEHDWWDTMGGWDYIIHLAPVSPSRAIAFAKRNNARLLYCSSGIVYHPENNIEYRQNKIKWELECQESGVDVVIARLFTFYGEHLDEHKAYTQFTKAAKANKPIEIWGDGNTVRSYMHGSELGEWMWAILLHGESGQAYDVGDTKPVTMLQLAKFIKLQTRSKPEIIIKGGVDPMPSYLPVDTAKTKALLKT